MNCPHCGASLSDGAAYCAQCGSPVSGAASGGVPSSAYSEEPYIDAPLTETFEVATFGPRLVAWLLDALFATIFAILVAVAIAFVIAIIVMAGQGDPATLAEEARQEQDAEDAAIIGVYLGYVPAFYAYHWIGTALGGGWGKRILGLRVVQIASGQNPGWGRGLLRVFVSVFSGVLYIGYLWSLWDDDRRTWHDKAAGTTVIVTR